MRTGGTTGHSPSRRPVPTRFPEWRAAPRPDTPALTMPPPPWSAQVPGHRRQCGVHLLLVQVRRDSSDNHGRERETGEPQRACRLADVERHTGRRSPPDARPERSGRNHGLSRVEDGFRDPGLVVGRKYEYRVIGIDEALNRAEQKVNVVASGPLLSPAPAQRVTAPPKLAWTAVKRASYYNIQLIRGRKVLSVWPTRTSFQLQSAWRYKGRRYRLRPGVYRWYVWPGYGRPSAGRFGRLLGGSTFVVSG